VNLLFTHPNRIIAKKRPVRRFGGGAAPPDGDNDAEFDSTGHFRHGSPMKTPFQVGSSGRVSVPPEKRFPINNTVDEFYS
jgi:hypothetical protein